jgi:hypothetical protein
MKTPLVMNALMVGAVARGGRRFGTSVHHFLDRRQRHEIPAAPAYTLSS